MARASSALRVSPTMPRMSYSRRIVGSNLWLIGSTLLRSGGLGRWIDSGQRCDHAPELGRDVRTGETEGDVRFEEADLVAAIIALALEAQAVERLAAEELDHGVGQLDLAAGTAAGVLQMAEDRRGQHIAADDRQRRRCLGRVRLLDQAAHGGKAPVVREIGRAHV